MAANKNLLRALINCAEKASNIARLCRSNEELLALLVQEKTGAEANQRFEHDFKTLADVLIQETIKYEIGVLFPAMRDAIQGEESPSFTNKLGEKVYIVVGDTEDETAACLRAVLGDHKAAAGALAAEVHRKVIYEDEKLGDIPELPTELDYGNLGIWIDPIDATAEYISGEKIFDNSTRIITEGLDCVTVLIGVYERDSGIPVMGIVAQPFGKKLEGHVYGTSLYWGVCLSTLQAHNCTLNHRRRKVAVFSSSETSKILQHFLDLRYYLAFSAGAGHKALKVICNEATAYVLSKGTTFRWDTCAPQAILRALGGDILDCATSVAEQKAVPINYLTPEANKIESDSDWKRNANGLIAVRNMETAKEILLKLKED